MILCLTLCARRFFLALPKVTKDRGHIAVTILVDQLPARANRYIQAIIGLIGFACLAFAAYVSLQENWRQYSKNIETLAIVPIPQWWVSGFITFGLALSALYMLRYLAHNTGETSAGDALTPASSDGLACNAARRYCDPAGIVLVRRADLSGVFIRNLGRRVFHYRPRGVPDVHQQCPRHCFDHFASLDSIIYLNG